MGVNNLPKVATRQRSGGRGSNSRPLSHRSDTLATRPSSHPELAISLCLLSWRGAVLSLVSSILTLTLIACDRFFGIVFAMKARVTERRSTLLIALVWIVAVTLSSPILVYRRQFVRRWLDHTELWCDDNWPPVRAARIRFGESGFRFRECKRAHDSLSCTRLHAHSSNTFTECTSLRNYTIVYTNMAAVTKFVAKSNKTTTSASKTKLTWHFGDFLHTSFVYTFTKLHDRRIPTRYPNPDS